MSIVSDEELRLDYDPTQQTLKITTNRMVVTPNPDPEGDPLQAVERTSVVLTKVQQHNLFHIMRHIIGL